MEWLTFFPQFSLLFSPLSIKNINYAGRIQYKTTYACEGKQLDLSCEDGRLIHLVRANYGRFSLSICNPTGQLDLSVNCMSFRSFLIMQDKCSQASNCSVVVSTKIFGDPCPGTSKYLEVQYHCVHPNAAEPVMPVMSSSPSPPIFGSLPTKGSDDIDNNKPNSENSDMFAMNKPEGTGQPAIESSSSTDLTGVKPPYETFPGNVTTTAVVPSSTPTASTAISTSRSNGVARMSNMDSMASASGFKPSSSHHHSGHHGHRPNRPPFNAPDILRQPIPPRPEMSLPPWLETDPTSNPTSTKDEGIFVLSSPDGRSRPTAGSFPDSSSSSSDQQQGSFEDASATNTVQTEEDDDMILMAVALFFIVFFLVMGTFGLIYCIIRSDTVRSRKFVRQIPFIHCLVGQDSLGSSDLDSNVEKISSVVQSSAYGSTGLSSTLHLHQHNNFVPIVATRVPTQITSTEHSTNSPVSKFMTLQQQQHHLQQLQGNSPSVRPAPVISLYDKYDRALPPIPIHYNTSAAITSSSCCSPAASNVIPAANACRPTPPYPGIAWQHHNDDCIFCFECLFVFALCVSRVSSSCHRVLHATFCSCIPDFFFCQKVLQTSFASHQAYPM